MGYKVLGYVVWNGGKWYVKRRYGWIVPSKTTVLAGATVAAVVAALLLQGDRSRR